MAPIPVVKQIHLYSHLWYTCTKNEQYSESLLNLDIMSTFTIMKGGFYCTFAVGTESGFGGACVDILYLSVGFLPPAMPEVYNVVIINQE